MNTALSRVQHGAVHLAATSVDIPSGQKKIGELAMADKFIRIGSFTTQSPTHETNEDRVVSEIFEEDSPLSAYVAVLDGHGGDECSSYVSEKIGARVVQAFKDRQAWHEYKETLEDLFKDIDGEFCSLPMNVHNNAGACATLIVVKENEVIIGNIGDCRAVMQPIDTAERYKACVELTVDHRADAGHEQGRMIEAGARKLLRQGRGKRILALEPSRTFGDLDVKMAGGEDVVIAKPDVRRIEILNIKVPSQSREFSAIDTSDDSMNLNVFNNADAVENYENGLIAAQSGTSTTASNKKSNAGMSFPNLGKFLSKNRGKGSDAGIARSQRRRSAGAQVLQTFRSKRKVDKPFLVVATDGVWDVMKNSDVVKLAKESLKRTNYDVDKCAEELVKRAKERGSEDDITAAVIVWG